MVNGVESVAWRGDRKRVEEALNRDWGVGAVYNGGTFLIVCVE